MNFRNGILLFLLVVIPATVSARWIEDKVVFQTVSAGNVEFSHYNHLEAVGKNCPTCHNDVFHIVRKKNKSTTMDQMGEGKSCGFCHNGERAFSVADDCSSCHPTKDIVFKIPSAGEVTFSHDVHTSMFGCGDCHAGIYNPSDNNPTFTMSKMEGGESCGVCHDGDTAFSVAEDCSSCHPTKDIVFNIPSAGEVTFSHDVHTGMFGCSDCHTGIFNPSDDNPTFTMSKMEGGESCGACHEGDTAFSVADDCGSCHPTKDITFETDAGNATFSHDVHTMMYKCDTCHPDIFQPNSKNTRYSMGDMSDGMSCGACHDDDTAFTVEDNCDNCHDM